MNLSKIGVALVALLAGVLLFIAGYALGNKERSLRENREPVTAEAPAEEVVETPAPVAPEMDPPVSGVTQAVGQVIEPDGTTLETREGRLATMALADERAALDRQVSELEQQVDQLLQSVAEGRMEADLVKAERERRDTELGVRGAGRALQPIRLVDANEALGLVALGGGSRQGIRPGMRFRVLHEESETARIRVVEVREQLSAAVVEEVSRDFPAGGDRVIPALSAGR